MAERLTSETQQAIAAGMPPCPNCNGRNVRASMPVSVEDALRAWFRYTPYRCRACQHRFYKRQPKSSQAAAQAAMTDPIKTDQAKTGEAKVG